MCAYLPQTSCAICRLNVQRLLPQPLRPLQQQHHIPLRLFPIVSQLPSAPIYHPSNLFHDRIVFLEPPDATSSHAVNERRPAPCDLELIDRVRNTRLHLQLDRASVLIMGGAEVDVRGFMGVVDPCPASCAFARSISKMSPRDWDFPATLLRRVTSSTPPGNGEGGRNSAHAC